MRSGRLTPDERLTLLREMTDDVARAGAAQQLPADAGDLARGSGAALDNLANQLRLMAELEARGLLDRSVEALPDDADAGGARRPAGAA